jgi:hypothetical protein
VVDDGEDAELARLDWIVWTLEVRDPEQRAAPDIGERTEQAMTEMAGSLGCVYSHCVDDDSYDLTRKAPTTDRRAPAKGCHVGEVAKRPASRRHAAASAGGVVAETRRNS